MQMTFDLDRDNVLLSFEECTFVLLPHYPSQFVLRANFPSESLENT